MKTTIPLLSISALAVTLLLAQPSMADDKEQLNEEQAQEYARDLLKSESERDGLRHIRDDEQEDYGYEDDDEDTAAPDDEDADQAN